MSLFCRYSIETVPSVQTTFVAGTSYFQLESLDIAVHCFIVPLKVILVSSLQPEKAPSPMLVTLPPIVTLVSPVQPLKAEEPMLVTPLPIVTLVRPLQP